MKTCLIPKMTADAELDLERLRTGANTHAVNNQMQALRCIDGLCKCMGCRGCGDFTDNLVALNNVRIWAQNQWAERFTWNRPKQNQRVRV